MPPGVLWLVALAWLTDIKQISGLTAPEPHFDVVVNSSSSLFRALQTVEANIIGISGRVALDSADFFAGAVVLTRSVTIAAVPQSSAAWQLADAAAQLSVGQGTTLTLQSFLIDTDLPSGNLFNAQSKQDSLLWPTVVLGAGEAPHSF